MSEPPPDSRASRRELVVSFLAFILGFIIARAAIARLTVQYIAPDARWWDVLHTSINAILISFVFGGLGAAALSLWAMSRYHYRRGFYRCHFCNKPLKGVGVPCDCPEAQALRK